MNGDPQWIKGQVFSYDDDLDAGAIAKLLDELEHPALAAVVPYEADGDPYLYLPKLARHQRLEPEKVRSRLPEPPAYVLQSGPDDPPPAAPRAPDPVPHVNSSESRADKSAPRSDESEPDAKQSALLYVAGGREHVAGGRWQGARARDPAADGLLANSLLDEHRGHVKPPLPRAVARQLGEKIDALLSDPEIDPGEIREALKRLRSNRTWGPGMLPNLVHEVRQQRAGQGAPRSRYSRQAETDDQFDRAMQRAQARDAQEAGNDQGETVSAHQVHPRMLPAAGD